MALGNHVMSSDNLHLMKDILAELNNCETMIALDEDNHEAQPQERTMDSIRLNEASGNWEAALRDYERLQQLRGDEKCDTKLKWGALRCLLRLGQFESVLNQVDGILRATDQISNAMLARPFAVEAAWRLGRWATLSDLVENEEMRMADIGNLNLDGRYQVAYGEAMLALQQQKPDNVAKAVKIARQAVMETLASVARESYSRSYPSMVRLQSLREIEDATEFLCALDGTQPMAFVDMTKSESRAGWGWNHRLAMVSPPSSTAIIDTRLALARLAKDRTLEGSLFLTVGKKARKNGLFNIALDALSLAESTFKCAPDGVGSREIEELLGRSKMQLAKLKHDSGQSGAALKMLGQDLVHELLDLNVAEARKKILAQETAFDGEGRVSRPGADVLIERFACRVLQKTQWMVEGGLKDGAEIINRFKLTITLAPDMEKGKGQCTLYKYSQRLHRLKMLMIITFAARTLLLCQVRGLPCTVSSACNG